MKSTQSNAVTLLVGLGGVAYLLAIYRNQPWNAIRIAGALIGLPSVALLILARYQLGGSFSMRARANALVTHGLYSRIRNPIYVFGGLVLAACCLYFNRPRYLLAFVVLVPLQIRRARQEEKVLAAKFGDEYRQYKQRTWF
jgi:protein-S-isoprenylcysteine O-methyltransferase Ste14